MKELANTIKDGGEGLLQYRGHFRSQCERVFDFDGENPDFLGHRQTKLPP